MLQSQYNSIYKQATKACHGRKTKTILQHCIFSGGRSVAPAGWVVANAEDMARWMKFMLSMGQNEDGVQVVSEAAMQRVRQPEVPVQLPGGGFVQPRFPETLVIANRYSLGLSLGYYKGRYIV